MSLIDNLFWTRDRYPPAPLKVYGRLHITNFFGEAMKKQLLLVLCLVGIPAHAQSQLTTTFSFNVNIGGTIQSVPFPTQDGMRMTLPSVFSDWNCTITHKFMSNDGKSVYHNIACVSATTGTIIGVSVSCPINSKGGDIDAFFLRKDGVNVGFTGQCITQ